MKRTYVDRIGEYYDNLDRIIDWGEEIDLAVYDPKNWIIEKQFRLAKVL